MARYLFLRTLVEWMMISLVLLSPRPDPGVEKDDDLLRQTRCPNPENFVAYLGNTRSFHVGQVKIHDDILSPTELRVNKPKFQPASTSKRRSIYLQRTFTMLLLICGDIHPCPGPNYKYPWGRCAKPVKRNQHGVACDVCDNWFHRTCINMDLETYKTIGKSTNDWYCDFCMIKLLPDFTDSFFFSSEADSLSNTSLDDTTPSPPSPRRMATI